ncbi:MAG: hypoxanthine phosphoribosyltransferase [Chloroflexia bacterium]|nr:hypoxanthine phosphoribosyltransferase [Chloroflexia bacterium]
MEEPGEAFVPVGPPPARGRDAAAPSETVRHGAPPDDDDFAVRYEGEGEPAVLRPARPAGGPEAGATVFGRVPFAHPAEAEFARLLDFYRIAWSYEPTGFPLAWEGERVTEMFTPDFYLPEQDLYVELTTMKQSLITRKHRKIRRFKEVYPEANVQLLTRRDYHELLARFGYAAVEITSLPREDIARVLHSPAEIAARVAALGAEISADYAGRSLVLVGLLKGVTFFVADLARAISRPLAIDFLSVARPDGSGAPQEVRIERDLDLDIRGRHVLLIEDIVNTGLTLDFVLGRLREREPASLELCVLFDKRERRLVEVPVRYSGFAIPNAYVVGYGRDHRELYRNLPFLCELRPEAYARESDRN